MNQFFNRHYMPLSATNCTKIVTDKRQNQLSDPKVWSLRRSQKGLFSLTGRGVWYRLDLNTIKSCENRDLSYLKVLFTDFMQFCGPWITD